MEIPNGQLVQIGVIHSPYKDKSEAPFQGRFKQDTSTIEVFEEYESALKDVETCSHLMILYWQDKGDRKKLQAKTPWGEEIHGVFATRSPNRPNPVAVCVVDLQKRDGRLLTVNSMDAVDGSPLIDIKPYSAKVDCIPDAVVGWNKEGKF
ncbi:MAG: tRNA (N6-threonylcarbamoyladenosine(37)-N6)-methyltransferase TrmO [Desulfatiglandaceae bacterium]|jgi:tRNA (adenine37-N6)-methyltransferase